MVGEAEFTAGLAKFAKTSADVRMAADNMIAVANVDVSRLNESLLTLMKWGGKIAVMLFQEINKHPSFREEIVEAQRMVFGNVNVISDVMVKYWPYLHQIAVNTGLLKVASKLLTAFFGL